MQVAWEVVRDTEEVAALLLERLTPPPAAEVVRLMLAAPGERETLSCFPWVAETGGGRRRGGGLQPRSSGYCWE